MRYIIVSMLAIIAISGDAADDAKIQQVKMLYQIADSYRQTYQDVSLSYYRISFIGKKQDKEAEAWLATVSDRLTNINSIEPNKRELLANSIFTEGKKKFNSGQFSLDEVASQFPKARIDHKTIALWPDNTAANLLPTVSIKSDQAYSYLFGAAGNKNTRIQRRDHSQYDFITGIDFLPLDLNYEQSKEMIERAIDDYLIDQTNTNLSLKVHRKCPTEKTVIDINWTLLFTNPDMIMSSYESIVGSVRTQRRKVFGYGKIQGEKTKITFPNAAILEGVNSVVILIVCSNIEYQKVYKDDNFKLSAAPQ